MPDTKFYTLLGVGKNATDDELKKAYKKAALKHHPDRGGDAAKFKEVSEAYEVLSDKNKRAVYDQFGEAGLKGGPPPGASGPGGMGSNPFGAGGFSGFPGGMPGGQTFSFSSGGGGNPFGGAGGGMDPRDLFSSLFGDIGGMGGGGGRPRPGSRSSFAFADDSDDAMPGAFGGGPGRSRSTAAAPEPATEIVKPLPVSLEDLYGGATKRMKISRRLLDGGSEDKVLEVKIVPGYKQGTRIKFKGAGNEEVKGQSVTSQDVAFVIEEKPHATYKREGDDAVVRFKVPLVDALTGPTSPTGGRKSITTLDGRTLPFALPTAPIKPDQEVRIAGEGFPITRKDSAKRKGDLIVRIEVVFPTRLTDAQATAVRKALS